MFTLLSDKLVAGIKRFPYSFFYVVVVAFAMFLLISDTTDKIGSMALTGILGFFFSVAISQLNLSFRLHFMGQGLCLLSVVIYAIYLHPLKPEVFQEILSYGGLLGLSLLFIGVAPFVFSSNEKLFKDYNRHYLLQFLESSLIGIVLFLGICLALYAIDILFNVDVDSRFFAYTGLFSYGVYSPLHFLSHFPQKSYQIEEENRLYSIIVQYIILPIITIYGLIVLLHAATTLFSNNETTVFTEWLLLWFILISLLGYLLVHYLIPGERKKWSVKFLSFYESGMLIIGVITIWSVFQRMFISGLSELRYLLILLSIFFISWGIYTWIKKSKQLKYIHYSLSFIIAISIVGPWSASNISLIVNKQLFINKLKANGAIAGKNISEENIVVPSIEYDRLYILHDFIIEREGSQFLDNYTGSTNLDKTNFNSFPVKPKSGPSSTFNDYFSIPYRSLLTMENEDGSEVLLLEIQNNKTYPSLAIDLQNGLAMVHRTSSFVDTFEIVDYSLTSLKAGDTFKLKGRFMSGKLTPIEGGIVNEGGVNKTSFMKALVYLKPQ